MENRENAYSSIEFRSDVPLSRKDVMVIGVALRIVRKL
jgi:hypothetical protein